MSNTDWITEGAAVVELTHNRWDEGGRIVPATIVKAGARDIVLDNGERYSRRFLTRSGEGAHASTRLRPANDPVIGDVRRGNRVNLARRAVRECFEDWRRNETVESVTELAAVAVALANLLREAEDNHE